MRRVRIYTKDGEIYEGIEMPLTNYDRSDVYIIKLNSGYNLAFDKNDIEHIEFLGDTKTRNIKDMTRSKNTKSSRSKILLLSTGGTIASKVEYGTGAVVASMDPSDLISLFPPWYNTDVDIIAKSIMEEMSENLTPEDWNFMISKTLEEAKKDNYKGVIIAHGTDTMHYSSAAFSFVIPYLLDIPVVFVGSQRSSDRPSTDAVLNIIGAIEFIKAYRGRGIFICMHGSISDNVLYVHYGTRVRKMHTSRRDAFKSVNYLPKAKVYVDLDNKKIDVVLNKFNETTIDLEKYKNMLYNFVYSDEVALVKYFPGMKSEDLKYFLDSKKGIIIEGTGLGHINLREKDRLVKIIKDYANRRFIGMTSQTIYGSTHPYVYKNLRLLNNLGVIFLKDMLPEVAYVKLCLAVSLFSDLKEIKDFMLTPLFFEIDERECVWDYQVQD